MLQSLVRDGTVDDIVAAYGHVIIDECHHVPAASFERVLGEVKARTSRASPPRPTDATDTSRSSTCSAGPFSSP